MSKVADEELERRAKNEYGNYNARLVGCSGQDFFGSPEELLLISRSGIDKLIPVPTIDFKLMGMDALVAFVIWDIGKSPIRRLADVHLPCWALDVDRQVGAWREIKLGQRN
jgi:hypothetical protein